MSIVRQDIFLGSYVVISEERAKRPMGFALGTPSGSGKIVCPFCPGNENLTPDELYKNKKQWSIRSFPNKYPALTNKAEEAIHTDFFGICDGAGEHEVLVDTNKHDENFEDFSETKIKDVLYALKSRYEHYRSIDGVKNVQIFKNNGQKAGATQRHSHWQIVAGKFIPFTQKVIGENLNKYRNQNNGCLYCDYIKNELISRDRLIYENERCVTLAPYASRFTYEAWILPKAHTCMFSELTEADMTHTANAVYTFLNMLKKVVNNVSYNILFMDSPVSERSQLYHWHIQILPRVGTLAGYEFSTGSYINHLTPECAAKQLRNCQIIS